MVEPAEKKPASSQESGGRNPPATPAVDKEKLDEIDDLKKLNSGLQEKVTELESAIEVLKSAIPPEPEELPEVDVEFGVISEENDRLRIQWRVAGSEEWNSSSWGPGDLPTIENAQSEIRDSARVLT